VWQRGMEKGEKEKNRGLMGAEVVGTRRKRKGRGGGRRGGRGGKVSGENVGEERLEVGRRSKGVGNCVVS